MINMYYRVLFPLIVESHIIFHLIHLQLLSLFSSIVFSSSFHFSHPTFSFLTTYSINLRPTLSRTATRRLTSSTLHCCSSCTRCCTRCLSLFILRSIRVLVRYFIPEKLETLRSHKLSHIGEIQLAFHSLNNSQHEEANQIDCDLTQTHHQR